VHEGGFAGAAGTDDGGELTLVDIEVEPIERTNLLFANAIGLGDVAKLDQGHWDSRFSIAGFLICGGSEV
jgi:hypothetical protein